MNNDACEHEMTWLEGKVIGGLKIIGCKKCEFMPSVSNTMSSVRIHYASDELQKSEEFTDLKNK